MEDQKMALRLKLAELDAIQVEISRAQTELDDLDSRRRTINAEITAIKDSLINGLINE